MIESAEFEFEWLIDGDDTHNAQLLLEMYLMIDNKTTISVAGDKIEIVRKRKVEHEILEFHSPDGGITIYTSENYEFDRYEDRMADGAIIFCRAYKDGDVLRGLLNIQKTFKIANALHIIPGSNPSICKSSQLNMMLVTSSSPQLLHNVWNANYGISYYGGMIAGAIQYDKLESMKYMTRDTRNRLIEAFTENQKFHKYLVYLIQSGEHGSIDDITNRFNLD